MRARDEPLRDEDEAALLARAAAWLEPGSGRADLTAETVRELAARDGVDFATAVLYQRLRREEGVAEFLERPRSSPRREPDRRALIGIVPGAFHREHRGTGADGAQVLKMARELGCAAEVIATGSFSTLEENARLILQWLATRRGQQIMLVSLSKGSAEVKRALALAAGGAEFGDVASWVSFSGMVQGTALIAWLRRHRLRWWGVHGLLWWHGYRMKTMVELDYGPRTPLAEWPSLPPHLRVIHVVGFPLRRHLAHPWAHRGHRRLAPLGPNDGGGILLEDCLNLPGTVVPVWGTDHYLSASPHWEGAPMLARILDAALAGGIGGRAF